MRGRVLPILAFSALLFALVGGTAGARPGLATTEHAHKVKARSAILRGRVQTPFSDSTWLFEYGRTAALGTYTRPVAVGAGRTQVRHKLRHLKPNTTYYFRLIVTEGGYIQNASFGATLHFKTKR